MKKLTRGNPAKADHFIRLAFVYRKCFSAIFTVWLI